MGSCIAPAAGTLPQTVVPENNLKLLTVCLGKHDLQSFGNFSVKSIQNPTGYPDGLLSLPS